MYVNAKLKDYSANPPILLVSQEITPINSFFSNSLAAICKHIDL